jgi:hypothetical protein
VKKKELLDKIAPCSLMCHTCSAYDHGVIFRAAKQLSKYTEGMCEFYKKHCPNEVERFNAFQEELAKYCAGNCLGCRERKHNRCSIKGCFILDCTIEHDIDYCGECAEFPCDKTQKIFEEEVYMQWLKGNQEIKALAIEGFWKKNCEKPHYKVYKE